MAANQSGGILAIHWRRSAASSAHEDVEQPTGVDVDHPGHEHPASAPPGVPVHRLVEPDRPARRRPARGRLRAACRRRSPPPRRRASPPRSSSHTALPRRSPGPPAGRSRSVPDWSDGAGARPATTPRSRSWSRSRGRHSATPACASGCAPGGRRGPRSRSTTSRRSLGRAIVPHLVAPDHGLGGLDQVLELAVELIHLEQPESRQPEHHDCRFIHRRGLSFLGAVRQPREWRCPYATH